MNKLLIVSFCLMLTNIKSNQIDYNVAWRNASLKSIKSQMNKNLLKDKELEFTFKEIIEMINDLSGSDEGLNNRKNFINFWLKKNLEKAKKTDTIYIFEMEKSGERDHVYKYVEIKTNGKSQYYRFDKNADDWSIVKSKTIKYSLIADLFKMDLTKLKPNLKNKSADKSISMNPNCFKVVTRFCNNEIISKVFIYPDSKIYNKIDIITNSIH